MDDQETPTHIDSDKARAGETPHVTRYVLGISLTLIVIVFGALFLFR